jgi:hypothetical protein
VYESRSALRLPARRFEEASDEDKKMSDEWDFSELDHQLERIIADELPAIVKSYVRQEILAAVGPEDADEVTVEVIDQGSGALKVEIDAPSKLKYSIQKHLRRPMQSAGDAAISHTSD